MKLCFIVVIKNICILKKENFIIFGVVKVIWVVVFDIRVY